MGVGLVGVVVIKLRIESLWLAYAISAAMAGAMFWLGLHLDLRPLLAARRATMTREMREADDNKCKRLAQLLLVLALSVLPAIAVAIVVLKSDPRTCEAWFGQPLGVVMFVAMIAFNIGGCLVLAGATFRTFIHAVSHEEWPPPGYRGVRPWPVLRGRALSLLRIGAPLACVAAIACAVFSLWSAEAMWAMGEANGRLNCP